MKTNKTVYTCDNCGKEVAYNNETPMIGGSPVYAWYTLKKLWSYSYHSEFDFCSKECVKEWAEKDD